MQTLIAGGSKRTISVFPQCFRWFTHVFFLGLFGSLLTFSVKLNGVTVGLTEAPGTVEDRSSLHYVDLRCVGLGSSDHHARAAHKAKRDTSCESTNHRIPMSPNASNESLPEASRSQFKELIPDLPLDIFKDAGCTLAAF